MYLSTRFLSIMIAASTLASACTQIVVSQETAVKNDAITSPAQESGPTEVGSTETQTPVVASAAPTVNTALPVTPNTTSVNNTQALPSTAPATGGGLDSVEMKRLQDFQKRFEVEGKSPKGAIRMLFMALLELEKNPKLAGVMVTAVYNGKKMTADSSSPTGFSIGSSDRFILDQLRQRPEIAHSYLGGTPDKNYENFHASGNTMNFPPTGALIGGVRVNNTLEGNAEGQIYIKSNGKDIATPLRLERNNQGLFKIDPSSVSSVATGVKQAAPENF